jgi:hypothetical protein
MDLEKAGSEMNDVTRTSKERDLSEYLGKDREELRAIIGERDAEIERLTRNCGEVAAAYVLRQQGAPSRPFTPEEARAYRSFIEEYFGPAPEPPAAPNPFEDRARAWDAIARKLEEINPHTFEAHKTGLQCALDEIERLQDRSIVASEFAAKCVAAVGRDPNVESVNLFELADQVVGCIEQYKHEAERAAQPPVPDDTTRLNWWFMNVLHDSDDDESGSDIEYEARLCRTPDEFRKLIDAERGTVPTKGEAP